MTAVTDGIVAAGETPESVPNHLMSDWHEACGSRGGASATTVFLVLTLTIFCTTTALNAGPLFDNFGAGIGRMDESCNRTLIAQEEVGVGSSYDDYYAVGAKILTDYGVSPVVFYGGESAVLAAVHESFGARAGLNAAALSRKLGERVYLAALLFYVYYTEFDSSPCLADFDVDRVYYATGRTSWQLHVALVKDFGGVANRWWTKREYGPETNQLSCKECVLQESGTGQ